MKPQAHTVPTITNVTSESDASYLIANEQVVEKKAYPIGEIEVRPKEYPSISLGNYDSTNTPVGFAIQVHPKPSSETIVTQIIRLGTDEAYELVLRIANHGDKTICAEVWQQAAV